MVNVHTTLKKELRARHGGTCRPRTLEAGAG